MRISLKSGMASRLMFFHSSGPTLTRAAIVRRASAALTPGIFRTTCTSSSSKASVESVALAGFTAIQVPVKSRIKITREPPTMPIAKTPTAIESTTSRVRVLLLHRSRSTLRQRGLRMAHLLRARGDVLAEALIGDPVDRHFGRFGLGEQAGEFLAVERHDFDILFPCRPHRGGARAAAQQADLAEILARAQRRDRNILPAGVVQQNVDLAFRDDIELVGHLALGDNRRAGRIRARLEPAAHPAELIDAECRERFGHILVDDLAVGDDDGAADALG